MSLAALAEEPKAAPVASGPAPKDEGFNTALFEATLGCRKAGEVCLDHCVRSLSTGDKAMAECASAVRAMLPMCEAMSKLTLLKSTHMKELAAVCAKTCRDCEAACKKHAKHLRSARPAWRAARSAPPSARRQPPPNLEGSFWPLHPPHPPHPTALLNSRCFAR